MSLLTFLLSCQDGRPFQSSEDRYLPVGLNLGQGTSDVF
jgi:hypothetical protein